MIEPTRSPMLKPSWAPARGYRGWVLLLCFLSYALSLVDRQILAILAEPVRKDLGLSDGRIGLLTGLGFGVFYAVCGIPIARYADGGSRRRVIALCVLGWSVATAACGAVSGFGQLLAARAGVAVGEGGAGPATHSLLSDYYPPQRRGTALSLYSMGIYVGAAAGLILGGWLFARVGWRLAFVIVAAPGLIVSLLIALTVQDPRLNGIRPPRESWIDASRTLLRQPIYVRLLLGLSISQLALQAGMQWIPAFLMRTYALDPAGAGARIGPILAVGGIVGLGGGGLLADRLLRRDAGGHPRVAGIAVIAAFPFALGILLAPTLPLALACVAGQSLLTAAIAGPTFAAIQNVVLEKDRALAPALLGIMVALIGYGIGPTIVGLGSDILLALHIGHPLAWALGATMLAYPAGGLWYLSAARRMSVPGDS